MIADLTRLREEREALALGEEKRKKRNGRLMRWSLRLFLFWPICTAMLWGLYHIGYESGSLARYAAECLKQ